MRLAIMPHAHKANSSPPSAVRNSYKRHHFPQRRPVKRHVVPIVHAQPPISHELFVDLGAKSRELSLASALVLPLDLFVAHVLLFHPPQSVVVFFHWKDLSGIFLHISIALP
jgi:hypothetical protein